MTEGPGFSAAGLDGSPVYPVTYQSLSLLVHRCGDAPYSSTQEVDVFRWVTEHHSVLEKAMAEAGTVLPLRLNTIVRGSDEQVLAWLQDNQQGLEATLDRLRGKAEYDIEVRKPKATKPPNPQPGGRNYLLAKKDELQALKDSHAEVESLAAELRGLLEPWLDGLKFLDGEVAEGGFFKASLLLARDKVEAFGVLLDHVATTHGLKVHFAGPLPPYSFVADWRVFR